MPSSSLSLSLSMTAAREAKTSVAKLSRVRGSERREVMVAEEEGRRREERGNRRGIDLVICLAFVADSPNSVRSIRPFVACDGKGWSQVSGLR